MSPSILSDLLKNISFGKPKDKQPDPSDSTPLSPSTTVANESQKSESSAHPFRLGNFSVDEYKPLKVVVIGAGFSGIVAGIRFRQKIPNLNLTIYDKNSGIGGTWYTNKYPGLACDIPSHSYQLTFEEKTDWSAFYAPGPEILSYLQGVVSKYKLGPYINLQHELVHAKYDEDSGKWVLKIRRPKAQVDNGDDANANPASVEYEEFEDTADLLFTGVGALSRWSWPDIEGLDTFQGRLVHSAQWDVEGSEGGSSWEEGVKDWKDKKVGVIGVGSSAIQIVPALRPKVSRLFNYVRGKTWLSPPFSVAKMAELIQRDPTGDNYAFTDQDKERFKDPEYYKEFRHEIDNDLNSIHLATLKDTPMQKGARTAFKENMIKRLEKKPWIADHLIPDFGVACRRLTPGPGYLEALCEDNVDFVNVGIKRVMEGGIETVDGKVQELDVIVCATGYDTTFHLPFPIIGKNGISLQDKWTPHPTTYLSTCIDDFPNYFFSLGPNSAVGSGSLLAVIEHQVDYAVMVGMKMQRERLKSVVVKKGAVEDFDEYLEHYFPTSVYSEKCRSWYKMGKEEGRVVALWPGTYVPIKLVKPPIQRFALSRQ
ncbi:hypothetical protein NLI96_g8512 [Meripilus lineatus]|uniref:FAD/NAD(P)-binding domain-containing protein n=1 Tax=Meripilus lineatus TaxID=2056292 RepID=A0AAD5YDW4_9APHY|nr:hypothetical protein NLI96_g8512 [Physisporinus lineatus]